MSEELTPEQIKAATNNALATNGRFGASEA